MNKLKTGDRIVFYPPSGNKKLKGVVTCLGSVGGTLWFTEDGCQASVKVWVWQCRKLKPARYGWAIVHTLEDGNIKIEAELHWSKEDAINEARELGYEVGEDVKFVRIRFPGK